MVADESMTFRYVALYEGNAYPIAGERAWNNWYGKTVAQTVILGMNPPQNRVEDLGGTLLASQDLKLKSLCVGDTITIDWNLS